VRGQGRSGSEQPLEVAPSGQGAGSAPVPLAEDQD